jgi:hypothetical protein
MGNPKPTAFALQLDPMTVAPPDAAAVRRAMTAPVQVPPYVTEQPPDLFGARLRLEEAARRVEALITDAEVRRYEFHSARAAERYARGLFDVETRVLHIDPAVSDEIEAALQGVHTPATFHAMRTLVHEHGQASSPLGKLPTAGREYQLPWGELHRRSHRRTPRTKRRNAHVHGR